MNTFLNGLLKCDKFPKTVFLRVFPKNEHILKKWIDCKRRGELRSKPPVFCTQYDMLSSC
jgi:hypothetical protein